MRVDFFKSKIRCLVDRCSGLHYSALHRDDFRNSQRSDFQATSKKGFQPRNNLVQSNYGRNFNHTTSQLLSTISNTPNTNNRRRYNQNNFNSRNPSYGNNSSHQTANQQHINPQQSNDRSNTHLQLVTSNELNDCSAKLPRVQNHTCSKKFWTHMGQSFYSTTSDTSHALLQRLQHRDLCTFGQWKW